MVVEADESDGSFLRLDGTIAVVTNIDPEHLEHYGGFEEVKKAYCEFIENVPFYGLAVMCVDHPEVQNIIGRIRDRRIVTYGFSALADLRADNVTPGPAARGSTLSFASATAAAGRSRRSRCRCRAGTMSRMRWRRSPSRWSLGLTDEQIRDGFARFDGVKRRFSKVGEFDGVTDHRRLRAPSGRDPRRPLRRARERAGAGHRGHAAAPLHAASRSDGRLPERVQRRGHRVRDAGLCGRRGADRGRGFRSPGRGAARARPSHGADGQRPRRPLRSAARSRRAGRPDHLHGRGRHHEVGGCAGRWRLREARGRSK